MKEEIITLFDKTGKGKIDFEPNIRIKPKPDSVSTWIECIMKYKDSYLLVIGNQKDRMVKNIDNIDHSILASVHARLNEQSSKIFTNK